MTARHPYPAVRVPSELQVYVDTIGEQKAMDVFMAFGGTHLNFDYRTKGRSELAKLIGTEDANALIEQAHRLPRRVPLANYWMALVLARRGWTHTAICRHLRVSETALRNYFKAAGRDFPRDREGGDQPAPGPDDRQMTLF
ncbi:hypothetical protein [Thalassococcus sp. S3]|uniref:hypothetical protein n=1 Tax=Thalassococcus sp. S3 TaxID=2017482 RepID=UPI00102473FE|nr:hypothetical protein [Thalassococcus sp. S3]QBF31518.1 hypothetical protein CFI11_09855 [Thalassococcus sp. S3]